MPLAINTSDPLASRLSYLFIVDDDNTIKDLKGAATVTRPSAVLLPNSTPTASSTTPYGRSFRTAAGTPGSPAAVPPLVSVTGTNTPSNGPISYFIVLNRYNGNSGIGQTDDLIAGYPVLRVNPSNKLTTAQYSTVPTPSAPVTSGSAPTSGGSIALTRNGTAANSIFIYLNGTVDSNFSGGLNYNSSQFGGVDAAGQINNFGGYPSYGWVSADIVFCAVFVGYVLTAADVARLHASLTGNNAFALIQSPNLSFSGTVPNKSGTVGVVFSWGANALSSYFIGGASPLAYTVSTGALPGGLSINTSTGVVSGTPTAGGTFSATFRATDAGGATATSNAVTFTIASGGGGDTTPPSLTGTLTASAITSSSYTLSWPAGTDNVAVTSYEVSLDNGSTWSNVGNVLTTAISGRTPGSTDSARVRARDAAGNVSTPALAASVTLLNGGGGTATVTSEPFKNGAGTLLANTAIAKVALLRLSDMVNVLTLSNQTTNAAGVLVVSNAALAAGTVYLLVTSNAAGTAFGCQPYTAA